MGSNLAFSVLTLRAFSNLGHFRSETPIETLKVSPQFSGFFASEVLGSKFLRRISAGVDRDGNGRAGEVGRSGSQHGVMVDGVSYALGDAVGSFLLEVSGNNNWRGSFLLDDEGNYLWDQWDQFCSRGMIQPLAFRKLPDPFELIFFLNVLEKFPL